MDKTLTIVDIPESTRYWIVRANGGEFYSEFYLTNTISIGDNDLKLKNFKSIKNLKKFKENVKKVYEKSNHSPQQVGIISNRLYRFIHEISVGDVILVPNYKSQKFLLGVVTTEVKERSEEEFSEVSNLLSQHQIIENSSNNNKYREVEWINSIDRKNISEKLLYILTMHQSIIEIKDHTYLIDNLISPIHTKNGELHCNFYVNTKENIDSEEWEKLFELINEVKNKDEKIIAKTNVQSEGLITLISNGFLSLTALYLLIGEIEIAGIKFKGLLPTIQARIKEQTEIKGLKTDNKIKDLDYEEKERNNEVGKIEHQLKMNDLQEKLQKIKQNKKVEETKNDFEMTTEIKKDEN